jgi:hypothetical protein
MIFTSFLKMDFQDIPRLASKKLGNLKSWGMVRSRCG